MDGAGGEEAVGKGRWWNGGSGNGVRQKYGVIVDGVIVQGVIIYGVIIYGVIIHGVIVQGVAFTASLVTAFCGVFGMSRGWPMQPWAGPTE